MLMYMAKAKDSTPLIQKPVVNSTPNQIRPLPIILYSLLQIHLKFIPHLFFKLLLIISQTKFVNISSFHLLGEGTAHGIADSCSLEKQIKTID